MTGDLPFQPMRTSLYTPDELSHGLVADDPASLSRTRDFAIYRYWVMKGRFKPNYADGTMQALHDNSLSHCVGNFARDRQIAGIMGGHGEDRGTDAYRAVAHLAHGLTRRGFLVATGGGPGMMEAAHLGAFYAHEDTMALDAAIDTFAHAAVFPKDAGDVVNRHGHVNRDIRAALYAWQAPVLAVRDRIARAGESLGIPTWRYGHEPTCLLATHIAKYFENSIREDGLLALARNGIVYAAGGAGTLQEVFQDAVFNAYYDDDLPPAPMIFFGGAFWAKMPVVPVLEALFGAERFARFVHVTDEAEEIIEILDAFAGERGRGTSSARRGLALSTPVIGELEPEGGAGWVV